MARPIWNGTVSFGLLNVPVQLYSAERSAELRFRLLDSRNRSPVRYQRINAETGKEVDWKDIVKAYEYRKGNYVVLAEDEIRAAAPEATESVEIEAFVARDSISPVHFEKPYLLVPRKKAEKGYVLLRETLKRTGRVGIGKVVIRTRQYLAALMPEQDALILDLMRFTDELVAPAEFELPSGRTADYHILPRELDMAAQLIDSMTTEWKPEEYRDDFREKVRALIEQRIAAEGGASVPEPPAAPARNASTNVVDFMALLKRSLESKAAGARKPASTRPARRREASVGENDAGAVRTGRTHAPARKSQLSHAPAHRHRTG